LLDLALRRDPDFLQKLAHAHVEGVFVHGVLLSAQCRAG
jgi:hypothetical protein